MAAIIPPTVGAPIIGGTAGSNLSVGTGGVFRQLGITSVASSATPTPNVSTTNTYEITALAAAALITNPTGTPLDGQFLSFRIKDNGTARALTFDTLYRAGTDVVFPTTTVLSKTLYMLFRYNSADTKYDLLAVVNNI